VSNFTAHDCCCQQYSEGPGEPGEKAVSGEVDPWNRQKVAIEFEKPHHEIIVLRQLVVVRSDERMHIGGY
jgi:hypothetical protein